jgi:leader peptidase (prepilin peptidase) / N-methyltransferase
MTELAELLADAPWLLATVVFVLGLLVGSFLNVVIHRLPIMMEQEWKAQAQEILREGPADTSPGETTHVSHATDTAEATTTQALMASSADQHSEILDDAVLAGVVDVEPDPVTSEVIDLEIAVTENAPPDLAPAPPTEERYNLVVPRSRCPKCNAEITALQNIPVFSWLFLGGRCANCQAPISVRYPIVEFVTALLSAAVALRFGWHWQTLFALVFTWALVALTVIDIDHTLLPDAITIPLLWLGLLLSVFWHAGLAPPAPVDPVSAILGAVAGYLILWSVYWVFKLATGKEGMGYGDFKLLGALGAWMGWQMLPLVLLLSAATGAIVGIGLIVLRGRDRNLPMPFGPYLAVAGWVALMWGPEIAGGYLSYTGLGP